MAEPQPSKLVMRVRFPSPAPAEKTVVTGPKQVAALISSGSLPKSRATDGPQQAVLCITPGLLRPSRSAGPDLLDEAAEGLGYSLVAISGRVLVDHRGARARMAKPRHQLLEARPGSRGPD